MFYIDNDYAVSPGPLFTKRMDVLPQDHAKSRCRFNFSSRSEILKEPPQQRCRNVRFAFS